MPLVFYSGSGSPFAWKVHLALEAKGIAYEPRVLSFAAGDTRQPAFLAINPRGRVPAIDDDGFVLWESNAIVEYLDEAYADAGLELIPGDTRQRALVRRFLCEIDSYVYPALSRLLDASSSQPGDRDPSEVASARRGVAEELERFASAMRGEFLAGPCSAADFALYPYVAFLFRIEQKRMADLDAAAMLPAPLKQWQERIESLPFCGRTTPPHWSER